MSVTGGQIISLSEEQQLRYRKQLSLPGMSASKQATLLNSCILVVAGGDPVNYLLRHLVAAGIGKIRVASFEDSDPVQMPSQSECNPDVSIEYHTTLRRDVPDVLLEGVELIIESSLDWQFKLRLSDLCMRLRIPLIHSGASGLRCQLYTMVPGQSACLRCALPVAGIDDVPLTNVENDSFAPIAACVGALMALESIKLMGELGVTQGNELWKIDGLSGEIEIVRGLDPREDCPDCGRAG